MHILGRVTDATTGAPVGDVRVVLELGGRAVSVNSDDDGRFAWRDDSSGSGRSLEYRAEKPGFEPESGSREVGDDRFELRIDLQPRSIIATLLVRDPEGRLLPGAEVRLERDGRVMAETKSGAGGAAELAIPAGGSDASLRYRVTLDGYQTAEGALDVVGADRPERTDVVLLPAGRTEPRDPLEAVRAHADYSSLMDHRPSSAGLYVNPVASVIAGVLFVGFGVMWIAITSNGPWPSGLAAVGLLIVAVGVAIAIHGFVRFGRLLSAPVRTSPALIVGKRTEVWGGGTDTSARTTYFLTLELEGGDRRELPTGGRVYGLAAEGDVGVAFTRGASLLDFRRLNA
jgi:hypothetical protein